TQSAAGHTGDLGQILLRQAFKHATEPACDRRLDEPSDRPADSLEDLAEELLQFLFARDLEQLLGERHLLRLAQGALPDLPEQVTDELLTFALAEQVADELLTFADLTEQVADELLTFAGLAEQVADELLALADLGVFLHAHDVSPSASLVV